MPGKTLIHSLRCEQTIINGFLVIFLQVTLSNLKASTQRFQALDHFFPTVRSHTGF